jgi:3-keto-disaccharide hydrolase
MKKFFCLLSLMSILTINLLAQVREGGDPKLSEVWQPEPRVVSPGKTPQDAPSDAIVLFSGKDLSQWQSAKGGDPTWKLQDDYVQVVPGTGIIQTKRAFGDCQLHIEWRTPDTVRGDGQGRGNSGIFFMGLFELQVLDNYNNRTYSNGQAGSIYKQSMPLVNACRPPGQWQTYDVIFTAPRFNIDSSLKSPARITVFQNGVLVQNNFSLWGGTEYIGIPVYKMIPEKLPLALQDHGNTVRYRNIWIREL